MFKKGEIVYHDDLVFIDGVKDPKKGRPCIVLFELVVGTVPSVLTCPVTSNMKGFNKCPDNYLLVPSTLYHYHKLSFAKTDNFVIKPLSQTHSEGIYVSEDFVDKIIDRLKCSEREEYEILKNYIFGQENKVEKSYQKIKLK